MGEYICEWCGETFDISQRLAAHTRWKHKDKPRIKSAEGKRKLGLDVDGSRGSHIDESSESLEKSVGTSEFFSNAGERLYGELKDSGKRTNIKNIVHLYENGNIDSPDWMNKCLILGGVGKPLRGLILARHYNIIDPVSIINKDTDETYEASPKESPFDYINEIARKDFELKEIQRQTDFLRQKPRQQPPQQPKNPEPDNGNKGKVEVAFPSQFDPSQPMRDAHGNIVTAKYSQIELDMWRQLGYDVGIDKGVQNDLKDDKTEITGMEKVFDDTLDALKESEQPKETPTQNIENDPAFIALKEQVDAQIAIRDRVLEENKALNKKEFPTEKGAKGGCCQIKSGENKMNDIKDAIDWLKRKEPLKQKDAQLRIEQQVLE